MTRTAVAAALMLASAAAPTRPALLSPPPLLSNLPQPTFRGGVDLVRLDVSVMHGGQPVRGLTAADFSIVDHGVTQRIESVTLGDDLPVSVMMALDVSGSVKGERLQHLVDAARGLVASLRPDDRAALVTFSRQIRTRVLLTHDHAALESALASLAGNGATAVRDAVWTALNLRPDDDSRAVVLLFTDGIDNASWLSTAQLLADVRRLGIVVHVVELAVYRNSFLADLSDAAGGRLWSATSSRDLKAAFTRAIDEMRARYLVTFYPQDVAREGWHELKVTVKVRGEVRARPGYYVAAR
jgi:Ca-activated chloride channel family protein